MRQSGASGPSPPSAPDAASCPGPLAHVAPAGPPSLSCAEGLQPSPQREPGRQPPSPEGPPLRRWAGGGLHSVPGGPLAGGDLIRERGLFRRRRADGELRLPLRPLLGPGLRRRPSFPGLPNGRVQWGRRPGGLHPAKSPRRCRTGGGQHGPRPHCQDLLERAGAWAR